MLTVWSGLSVGAIFVLVAVAFNLTWIGSSVFNFAHPQYLMLGTFIAYAAVESWDLSPWAAIPIGALVGAVLGAAEELIAIHPVRARGGHGELVTTVGWAVAIEGLAIVIWGVDPRPVTGVTSSRIVTVLGGRVTTSSLVLIGVAAAVALAAHLWTRFSLVGIVSAAASEDADAARVKGVNVRWLSIAAFAAGAGVLAAAGPIVGPNTFATYSLGSGLVLKVFVVLCIGGFGSIAGCAVAGFGLGLLEAHVQRWWGSSAGNLVDFALLLMLLSWRPNGLFGRVQERTV